MPSYALEEVFNEAGFPEVVFVQPKEFKYVRASLKTPGKHVTIAGPSGSGKTTIVMRILRDLDVKDADILWINGRQFSSLESGLTVFAQALACSSDFEEVTELLRMVKHVVIDDFHFLQASARQEIASLLKLWHEKNVRFVIIGIASSAEELLKVDPELGIRNDPYTFGKQSPEFVAELFTLGTEALNIKFSEQLCKSAIEASNGVPSIAHVIARICCITADIEETQTDEKIIDFRLQDIREEVLRIFHGKYRDKVVAIAKGKRQARSVHNTYFDIVAHIMRSDSSEIPKENLYHAIVGSITDRAERGRKSTSFYNCMSNLSEVIEQHGLQDTLLYKGGKYISIEDPSFRFYLNLLDIEDIRSRIHVRNTTYPFDVAVSFAGDVRPQVEEFVTALKARGLNVFYDFDQQSQLWGKDLRAKLAEVYSEDALYMVVFLSEAYPTRDWTDFEMQIGKAAAAKRTDEYLLPLRIDDVNVVGLRSTIGYLNLSEIGVDPAADILSEKVSAHQEAAAHV